MSDGLEVKGYIKTIQRLLWSIEKEVMTSQEDEIDWDEVDIDAKQIIDYAERISELRHQ